RQPWIVECARHQERHSCSCRILGEAHQRAHRRRAWPGRGTAVFASRKLARDHPIDLDHEESCKSWHSSFRVKARKQSEWVKTSRKSFPSRSKRFRKLTKLSAIG